MPDELTQPCPACGAPVDLGRRIPICQPCWRAVDVEKRKAVIDAWADRQARSGGYRKALDAAVTSLRVETIAPAGGVL